MLGTKILEKRDSKYNGTLRIVRTWGMGTYIQSDGLTQSGGIVEKIWSQTLKQIINSKLLINNCLILGLGAGTVAKLIRKKWPDAKITGVDIDPIMIELGKKYLELDKYNVDIKITDAFSFLTHHSPPKSYDLIIVDLYNGDKFPKNFETEKYIQLVKSLLTKNGITVFNRLYFKGKKEEAIEFRKKIFKVFKKVETIYPITNIMFIASK